MAGLSAERGIERKACAGGCLRGELAKRLRPSKLSVGSVSPQGLAVSYYHSQARQGHRPPSLVDTPIFLIQNAYGTT